MSTISFRFGRNKYADELSDNSSNFSKAEERRSCWSVLSINRVVIEAKIIHKRGGKFKILDDNRGGRYIGTIVDASDVIRCILTSSQS
jgi:hypothetical protein